MCGVSGVFSRNGCVEHALLKKMAMTMQHRGPDHMGFYISRDQCVGLAHNRLSIIDLSKSGNQPMSSSDGKVHISYNGEIYNFPQLRKGLIQKGHDFASNSDTEVLLHMYREYGVEMLQRLNGMFAFCIFDEGRHKFFLARDRVGIKPLYFSATEESFVFGSELKALLASGFVHDSLNDIGIDAFFTLGYIPFGMSIFKAVEKLPPAHYLEYELASGEKRMERYWSLPTVQPESRNEDDLVEELELLLDESVAAQMISDVPIGCFLSGGLDSSLCSVLMARNSNHPIKTFTICFDEEKYDERRYAQIVAESIGSEHIIHTVKIDAVEALEFLTNNYDEPFADSSMIPTYFVSKVAKEHVTVVLSGDGGDELFGGYNWYSWMLSLRDIDKRLAVFSKPVAAIASALPMQFRGKKFLSKLGGDPAKQLLERVEFFEQGGIVRPSENGFAEHFQQIFNSFEGSLLQKLTKNDFNCYLPDDILTKIDRASMAVSLEVRVPWLDHRLVEFAYRLPSEWKIRNGQKKYLPKRLAAKLLPAHLRLDRKRGFNIPLADWMKSDLGYWLDDVATQGEPYFEADLIRRHLVEHRSGKVNHASRLFAMLVFILWKQRFAIL